MLKVAPNQLSKSNLEVAPKSPKLERTSARLYMCARACVFEEGSTSPTGVGEEKEEEGVVGVGGGGGGGGAWKILITYLLQITFHVKTLCYKFHIHSNRSLYGPGTIKIFTIVVVVVKTCVGSYLPIILSKHCW